MPPPPRGFRQQQRDKKTLKEPLLCQRLVKTLLIILCVSSICETLHAAPVTIKLASILPFFGLTVGDFVWFGAAWGISFFCWFQVLATRPTIPICLVTPPRLLLVLTPAASIKSEPSTDLAPVTGLTVDEQFANGNCLLGLATPTECMARNAPDTPLVPISQACCRTFVTCLHLYLTSLAHRPCLASPLAARVLSALRHDILRTTRENTTPSRLSVPKRLLPPLQEFPAKMPAIRALDRLDTTTST